MVDRALESPDRSIREKPALFCADHWGTETNTIKNAHFIYKHNDLLRRTCLSNFRQMVKNVTIDPDMLIFYLNGYLNDDSAPHENYGPQVRAMLKVR